MPPPPHCGKGHTFNRFFCLPFPTQVGGQRVKCSVQYAIPGVMEAIPDSLVTALSLFISARTSAYFLTTSASKEPWHLCRSGKKEIGKMTRRNCEGRETRRKYKNLPELPSLSAPYPLLGHSGTSTGLPGQGHFCSH